MKVISRQHVDTPNECDHLWPPSCNIPLNDVFWTFGKFLLLFDSNSKLNPYRLVKYWQQATPNKSGLEQCALQHAIVQQPPIYHFVHHFNCDQAKKSIVPENQFEYLSVCTRVRPSSITKELLRCFCVGDTDAVVFQMAEFLSRLYVLFVAH